MANGFHHSTAIGTCRVYTTIHNLDRNIIGIHISIQTIYYIGVECTGFRADKSTPLRGVVPGVAVVQAGFGIVIVATVADGVGLCYGNVGSIAGNGAVTPHLYSTIIYVGSQEKGWPANASQQICNLLSQQL